MKKSLIRTVAVATVFAVAGCKDEGFAAKVFVKNGTSTKGPRIAVLPFDAADCVRSQDAGRLLTNTVITHLLSTGLFEIVDPGVLDEALVSNQIRITEGLRKTDLEALQKTLGVDGIILGLVEKCGDVRVGNDTYPSISFSARLINARTGIIVWAGTISKTGADKVTVFDIGRISSMGKLCKAAVQDMARSMAISYSQVELALAPGQPAAPVADHGTTIPTGPTTPAAPETPTAACGGKSADESKICTENELKALLPEVPGFTKGDFDYKKHVHDTIDGRYNLAGGKQFVEVRLIDYQKAAQAERFVQMYHADEEATKFAGLSAFIKTSEFGYEHVDLAVGRFGLFVRGPSAKKDDVEKVAAALVAAIK